MIRSIAIALLLTTASSRVFVPFAAAQTTTETDKSEEDWRKSQKKRDTSDIFKDYKNILSQGGNGIIVGPDNPMDNLPDESRRHLSKERAKAIAVSDPGQPIDAPYNPSDAAKTDPELAQMEEAAWKDLVDDLNGTVSTPPQGDTAPSGDAVTSPAGSEIETPPPEGQPGAPQQSGGSSGNSQDAPSKPQPSVMRGGSSASVSDILAQIKGMQSGGQSQNGQARSSNGPAQTENAQGSDGQAAGEQQPAEGGESGEKPSGTGNQAQPAGQTSAKDATAKARASAETISPLERIKRDKEANSTGSQTSASDYLKKTDK